MKRIMIGLVVCILLMSLAACGSPPDNSEQNEAFVNEPEESVQTEVNNPEPSGENTTIEQEEETTSEQEEAATPEPTVDPYAEVVHISLPGEPILSYWATDCSTGKYTPSPENPVIGVGCDEWNRNFLERPTDLALTAYYPHLDIVRFQMGKDANWIYADISMFKYPGEESVLDGVYSLEMDFDVDGDGDLLIMAIAPSGYPIGEWHTLGVQVWADTNDDIGGSKRILADDAEPGDGFESLVFDQGLGPDPDLAWARISPQDNGTVQFAFKRTLPPTSGAFLWWAWTSQVGFEPGLYDLVDHFGADEHGQLDNTCRWIFNGPPQPVPNICSFQQAKPNKGDDNTCEWYPEPVYSCKPCFWNEATCQWDCYC